MRKRSDRMGMCASGGGTATLRKWAARWGISTEHFDPYASQHGNGRDHRLENLRIVCANCAATLDTHCGRNVRMMDPRRCAECGSEFRPQAVEQRFCSLYCSQHHERPQMRVPRPETRKVPRPTFEQLKEDLSHMSWVAVGRKYGVSDNAVRKWMRWYKRDAEAA
jgi:transposase-like protein